MGPRGNRTKGSTFECPVCFTTAVHFSVGICNHSICQECSVRMRVLLGANECPICRQDLPEVYQTVSLTSFPKSSLLNEFFDRKSGIRFENEDVQRKFKSLVQHVCSICEDHVGFPNLKQLETHCQRKHELFYCQLCSEHLNLFTHERRLYTRTLLATHRRKGDRDDKSHKGHPCCEFCNQRFMDNEALFLHLRKEHYFCHFCDSHGQNNTYYPNYDTLRDHFGEQHYLCTEPSCKDSQFTHAFKSEIDFKAHLVEKHSFKNMTVDVEFNYKNRRGGAHSSRGGRNKIPPSREMVPAIFEEPILVQPQTIPDVNSAENFPSLSSSSGGGASNISRTASGDALAKKLAIKSGKSVPKWKSSDTSRTQEDFPSLGRPSNSAPPLTTNKSQKNVAQRIRDSDFANPSVDPRNSASWSSTTASNKKKVTNQAAAPFSSKPIVPKTTGEDFPGLDPPSRKRNGNNGKNGKKKSEDDYFNDCMVGGWKYQGNNLKNAANIISASNDSWSMVSNRNSNNNQSKNQTEAPIPGMKYATEKRHQSDFGQKDTNDSLTDLSNNFPSLGPSTKKISAHFQPNSRDPIPNQWDCVSTPDLFVPNEATGAKPKSTAPPPPPGFHFNSKQSKANNTEQTLPFGNVRSTYNPPKDFAVRNKKLLSLITRILGGKSLEFKEFMNISKKFRDESISSEGFYDKCVEIVSDNNKLMEFLPELIFLLPDIKKQQELHRLHQKKNSFLKIVYLEECDKCNQLLSSKDISQHRNSHSLDGDFPSL
ncbi:uncharacterized protein [Lepeophtheirus salmonis]|uniref:uncharacterized protein n=1 Tax=Lepeophtheirus salmonis TaxID=72036 RepID=UPI001AE44BB2|nr:E3 ubiquitin-protein ligase ZNF598-like [Lepeophtheirus salmonis]